jgi:hypothetical protein
MAWQLVWQIKKFTAADIDGCGWIRASLSDSKSARPPHFWSALRWRFFDAASAKHLCWISLARGSHSSNPLKTSSLRESRGGSVALARLQDLRTFGPALQFG